MRKQKELFEIQRAEHQRKIEMKLKKDDEEKKLREQQMLAEQRKRAEMIKQETAQREFALREEEELRKHEERRKLEIQKIEKESNTGKGQVTRRADDPFGQGFGFVKTGYVSSQKISILQRGGSVDRYESSSDLKRASPAFSNASLKTKGLRVTWAESPGSSRPGSTLSWTNQVADMDSQNLRAQTPPLASEWTVVKVSEAKTAPITHQSPAFATNSMSSSQSFSSSASKQMSSSVNGFSNSSGAQFQQMSSSAQSRSSQFSSSKSFQSASFQSSSSSSFQTGNVRSQTFEAFPGMGDIENLNLESEKAGN